MTLTYEPREEAPRCVLAKRRARTSRTTPSSDNHDRRRPVTTEERLLSTNT
jgi:hypothetical protein